MKNIDFMRMLSDFGFEISDMDYYVDEEFGFDIQFNGVDVEFCVDLSSADKMIFDLMQLVIELQESNFDKTDDEDEPYKPISAKVLQNGFDTKADIKALQELSKKFIFMIISLIAMTVEQSDDND